MRLVGCFAFGMSRDAPYKTEYAVRSFLVGFDHYLSIGQIVDDLAEADIQVYP